MVPTWAFVRELPTPPAPKYLAPERTFNDARYPSDLRSRTAYVPGHGTLAHDHTVTCIPAVPDAATRARALTRSGAVHAPAAVGSTVYGQCRRYAGKCGGRI